jgi:hypothetical protein
MDKRVVLGGLFAILAACGGQVDAASSAGEPAPLPPAGGEQGLYQPAQPSGPERVADGLGGPTAIAMTADAVLFTTHATTLSGEPVAAGGLYSADKRVGPALLLAVDRQGASFDALTLDATTAFIATSDGRLLRIPVMGGATTALATLDGPAVALAAAGDHVYFATGAGALGRVAKAGGAVEPLATIAGAVRGLEADGAALYVATAAAGAAPPAIAKVALAGGAVEVLATTGEPCAMIRDGRSLFWTSLAPVSPADPTALARGEVLTLSLDGGGARSLASGAFAACALASDRDSLYFATTVPSALPVQSGGARAGGSAGLGLMRAPIAGGQAAPVALASRALMQPGAVAVDASHVYWLTDTAVLRVKK